MAVTCDYMVAVVDTNNAKHLAFKHPFHNGIPFFIGYGERLPEYQFMMDYNEYKVMAVFTEKHSLNPFGKPVVMATKMNC